MSLSESVVNKRIALLTSQSEQHDKASINKIATRLAITKIALFRFIRKAIPENLPGRKKNVSAPHHEKNVR